MGRLRLVRSADFDEATWGEDHRPRNLLIELGS
jgi:hypothetical protein